MLRAPLRRRGRGRRAVPLDPGPALPARLRSGAVERARHTRAALAPGALLARLRALPRALAAALVSRLPVLAAGGAASIPVIVSTVRAVRAGWEPDGDDGIILTRALDVFTAHTPLVGQFSEAGNVTGQIVHSPGPMLYWLLAIPVRLGGPPSAAIAMGAVNCLCIVGCVALARRRGGLVLMVATALAIALMCRSLSAEIFHDVWNPSAAMFPFLLLIFVCWSLAAGDYRLLPALVVLASFVIQTHLAYLAPTVAIVAVAIAGLTATRLLDRRSARRRAIALPRRVVWRWAAAATVALGLCWSAPLIDEVEHDPGNLSLIVATVHDRGPTLGPRVGYYAVVRAIGVTPWFLSAPRSEWSRKNSVRETPPPGQAATALALIAGLALIALLAAARRRIDLAAAALIGLGMCLGLG
ncbi:MAG TPA: hypothetical protein VL977_08625, partial [Solirubrobacteraceae bacterium]|nr:hypothetical protein [Solirubrobacteraceae bacterium]